MQLFSFPCAGGTADFFSQLDPWFPDCVELVSLDYAGHGTRRRESLHSDFSSLADDMYAAIKRLYRPGGDYALFGYSMGSIAAAEVLSRIIQEGELPYPVRVFLAAHGPEVRGALRDFLSNEADEWVKRRTIALGGIPDKLLENRAFWRVYLPLYRADYTLLTSYDFNKLTLACEIPLTCLYGSQDVLSKDIRKWERYFQGECEFVEFDGNHFFITEHRQELVELIINRLERGGSAGGI